MDKIKIYHNPSCSKSREALRIIQEANTEHEVTYYLETPPSVTELDSILIQLRIEPEQIVRKGEDRYEELGLDAKPPKTRAECIQVLVNNPILIERPIATNGSNTVIGRPPENIRMLF